MLYELRTKGFKKKFTGLCGFSESSDVGGGLGWLKTCKVLQNINYRGLLSEESIGFSPSYQEDQKPFSSEQQMKAYSLPIDISVFVMYYTHGEMLTNPMCTHSVSELYVHNIYVQY